MTGKRGGAELHTASKGGDGVVSATVDPSRRNRVVAAIGARMGYGRGDRSRTARSVAMASTVRVGRRRRLRGALMSTAGIVLRDRTCGFTIRAAATRRAATSRPALGPGVEPCLDRRIEGARTVQGISGADQQRGGENQRKRACRQRSHEANRTSSPRIISGASSATKRIPRSDSPDFGSVRSGCDQAAALPVSASPAMELRIGVWVAASSCRN